MHLLGSQLGRLTEPEVKRSQQAVMLQATNLFLPFDTIN